jgi:hypothetical protein
MVLRLFILHPSKTRTTNFNLINRVYFSFIFFRSKLFSAPFVFRESSATAFESNIHLLFFSRVRPMLLSSPKFKEFRTREIEIIFLLLLRSLTSCLSGRFEERRQWKRLILTTIWDWLEISEFGTSPLDKEEEEEEEEGILVAVPQHVQ